LQAGLLAYASSRRRRLRKAFKTMQDKRQLGKFCAYQGKQASFGTGANTTAAVLEL